MEFYEQLALAYDLLFPPSREQRAWALDFADGGPILDAGCATGELLLSLARAGIRTFGFDPDELMISLAREKAAPLADPPEFRIGDLEGAAEMYQKGFFRRLICLGNTLAHLEDRESVQEVCFDLASLLGPGARIAVQLLNYDRIMRLKPTELPPLSYADGTREISFNREYRYDDKGIRFIGTLIDEEGENRSETRLQPIGRNQLETVLNGAGFTEVAVWSDYEETPADDDSPVLLFTAETPRP